MSEEKVYDGLQAAKSERRGPVMVQCVACGCQWKLGPAGDWLRLGNRDQACAECAHLYNVKMRSLPVRDVQPRVTPGDARARAEERDDQLQPTARSAPTWRCVRHNVVLSVSESCAACDAAAAALQRQPDPRTAALLRAVDALTELSKLLKEDHDA